MIGTTNAGTAASLKLVRIWAPRSPGKVFEDWREASKHPVYLAPKSISMGTVRLGANPPSSLVELHKRATQEVYAACGLNPSIFESGTGTQARESYRQALFGTIAPLGRIVETELRDKLNDPGIAIDWSELRAAEIASRARAFQSMVGGGMPLDRATALSGLMVPDDAA